MRMLALFLLMVFSGAGCAYPPPYASADKSSLRLERKTPLGTGVCSGWVYWDHAIVTDEHCIEDGTDGWTADGRTMRVLKVIKDGNDHVILITDLYFRHRAVMGPRPHVGDEVFTLGNPDSQFDILLISRVAGYRETYTVTGWRSFSKVILLDSNDWYGCSGAAIFDKHGRVVGMVNAMFPWPNRGWRLTAGFGLMFTKAQWREARKTLDSKWMASHDSPVNRPEPARIDWHRGRRLGVR